MNPERTRQKRKLVQQSLPMLPGGFLVEPEVTTDQPFVRLPRVHRQDGNEETHVGSTLETHRVWTKRRRCDGGEKGSAGDRRSSAAFRTGKPKGHPHSWGLDRNGKSAARASPLTKRTTQRGRVAKGAAGRAADSLSDIFAEEVPHPHARAYITPLLSPRSSARIPAPSDKNNLSASRSGDKWDSYHVKLPCSRHNRMEGVEKWPIIVKVFTQLKVLIDSVHAPLATNLVWAIRKVNPSYRRNWNLSALSDFLDSTKGHISDTEVETFKHAIKGMIQAVLELPFVCQRAIPLLRKQNARALTLTQKQVRSLLASAFFCLFPHRNASAGRGRFKFPTINFSSLFGAPCTPQRAAKLRCIFNYFRRQSHLEGDGNSISFCRRVLQEDAIPSWSESTLPITHLTVLTEGRIEDDAPPGSLEVDFANKLIGGGVLKTGCVQEEIRFLVNTELIVSRLFCEELDDNEAFIVKGAERFNAYTGYSRDFAWAGDLRDARPVDALGRTETTVCAIDAAPSLGGAREFNSIYRDINKAFAGYLDEATATTVLSPVASGHWGCGAFGGNKELKAVLQLLAAAQASRDLYFFSFGEEAFTKEFEDLYSCIRHESVGRVWNALQTYPDSYVVEGWSVFHHLKSTICS